MCFTEPFEIVELAQNLDINSQTLDLKNKDGQLAGSLKITTQLLIMNEDFAPIEVNDNCKIELNIQKVHFIKEADYAGPYVQFFYNNKEHVTKIEGSSK